jgi:hypothetical protein
MKLEEYYYNVQVLTMTECQKPHCLQRPKRGTMEKYGQMKSRWTNGKGLTRWRSMGISLPDLLKMGENT